jgi:hypothetical protein
VDSSQLNQTSSKGNQMKNIATALVKAQKAFGPALKSSTNPHFKSRYADLAACVEAVIEGLNSAGIALVQRTSLDDSGVTVETVFLHESGEMLECGKLHVPAIKHDPQGYGSALTYARRYSLMAACGIAPEDDDGNAGSRQPPKLTEATMQALLEDIASCTNEMELKNAYFEAIKAVGNNQKAKDHIIAAKDAKKATL